MSLSVQVQTMLAMIAMGGWLGVALDTYSRFLKRSQRKKWILFLYDFFFWVLQGLIIFYILLMVNQGTLRFYILLALLCGFAAYQSLFRNLYLNILEVCINVVIGIYRFFYRLIISLIVMPIKMVIQAIIVVVLFLLNSTWIVLKNIGKIVFTPLKWGGKLCLNMVPNKVNVFLTKKAGILKKIKNIITNWWKKRKR